MRLVFLGTPAMAVPPLRALHAAGHEIALVVTRPDARRGRGGRTTASPVKQAAQELGIPVGYEPDDALAAGAELGVVVAYGRIIKPHVLEALPMVNLHFSLLPRWRGAAPIERAILAGDDVTGVCVMDVEERLDTGGVYACDVVPIGPATTASELRQLLVMRGTELLVDTLATGLGAPEPQVGEPTYAAKIDRSELELDWTRPAVELHRIVRVGGAFTRFRGELMKVHEADLVAPVGSRSADDPTVQFAGTAAPAGNDDAPERPVPAPGRLTGDVVWGGDGGGLRLVRVQPAGRSAMSWRDYANGAHPVDGESFG